MTEFRNGLKSRGCYKSEKSINTGSELLNGEVQSDANDWFTSKESNPSKEINGGRMEDNLSYPGTRNYSPGEWIYKFKLQNLHQYLMRNYGMKVIGIAGLV